MIISDHPAARHISKDMSFADKLLYYSTGRVTVGRFARIKNRDFVNFYLPRIRSMNFGTGRRYKHPGYTTADQAYASGKILHKGFIRELAMHNH